MPRLVQDMKMTVIFIVVFMHEVSSLAQSRVKTITTQYSIPSEAPSAEIRELKIGDTVPNVEFELVNYPTKRVFFSDFRGKYIILDFWATWCAPCINKLPALDSFQQKFEDKSLQVLLVNTTTSGDTKNKIVSFFESKRSPSKQKYRLPSIVNDSIADKLFPHKTVPHYVLIDDKGIVRAITSSDEITEKNILSFIKGQNLDLILKKDLDYNRDMPFFINGNGGTDEKYIYRSFLTGHLSGLPCTNGIRRDKETQLVSRLYMINSSILMLYGMAYPEINNYPPNQFLLKVADPMKIQFNNVGEVSKSQVENAYSYELIVPPSTDERVRVLMREDLNRFFGLKVFTERKSVKCMVVTHNGGNTQILSNNGILETNLYDEGGEPKFMRNCPIKELFNFLNSKLEAPVINETNLIQKVSIELPSDPANIELLREVFKKYGLKIREEVREVEYFILSEN